MVGEQSRLTARIADLELRIAELRESTGAESGFIL
jgi:hypothetical protein